MLVTRCQTTRELKKLYEEQGVSKFYKKPPEQQDDERFYLQVTNPDTGTFYKLSDLPVAYRKFGEERTYPIRQVNQIIRIKRLDGTEWLRSRGRIVGLDKLGNEVEHSFTDPELFYKPQTRYELKLKNPKNESSPMERTCVSADINPTTLEYIEITLPFNTKNFEQIYKQRPSSTPGSVSLVVKLEGSNEGPRQIDDPEKFKNTPFDDLWTEATTPRYKLDRSYGDNLQDNQYK